MKKLILIIAVLLCVKTKAQNDLVFRPNPGVTFFDSFKDTTHQRDPKLKFSHILTYRTWNMNNSKKWTYTAVGFFSLKEVLEWLNEPYTKFSWHDYPEVKISEGQFVSLLDLEKNKEIKVKLKSEKKIKPEERIIEEISWTEEQYIIQK